MTCYSLWSNYNALLAFVNKVLLEHGQDTHLGVVCGCFCAAGAAMSSCPGDQMAHTAREMFAVWLFTEQDLLTPGLDRGLAFRSAAC